MVRSSLAPESNVMQATTGKPGLLGGGHGQAGLGRIGHGFDDDAVGPRGGHRPGLFRETGPQVVFADLAHHEHQRRWAPSRRRLSP